MRQAEVNQIAAKAQDVGQLLKALGNGRRLEILCKLIVQGEVNVTTLSAEVGLSMSALSQHLKKLRAEGLVTTRRDSTIVWYSLGDPKTEGLLKSLHRLYCVPE